MNNYLILCLLLFYVSMGFAQKQENPSSEKVWNYSVGASIGMNGVVRYDSMTISSLGSSFNGKAVIEYKNGFSLEADARLLDSNSWGVIGGLTYDSNRDEGRGLLTINGTSVNTSGEGGETLQVTILYGNAAYRWNQFYIPFGLNYDFVKYDSPNVNTTGGMGSQLGVGYYVKDDFVVEIMSRASLIRQSSKSGTVLLDTGNGYYSMLQLTAKYIFH